MATTDEKPGSDNSPTQNVLSAEIETPIEKPAWEQQEGEPARQFSWFYCFLMLGPSRSILGAYKKFCDQAGKSPKKPNQLPGAWKVASENWEWRGRAEQWDKQQRLEAERRRIEREIEEEKEFAQRRRNLRFKLLDRIEQRFKFPIHRTVVEENGKAITIEPISAAHDQALARLLEVQQKIEDELNSDETTVTVKSRKRRGARQESDDNDDDGLTDEERLERVLVLIDTGRKRRTSTPFAEVGEIASDVDAVSKQSAGDGAS